MFGFHVGDVTSTIVYGTLRAMLVTLDLHIIKVEKNVSRLLFHFFIPYLCLHTVGLVRMEVVLVCFDVLFFISEFHVCFY